MLRAPTKPSLVQISITARERYDACRSAVMVVVSAVSPGPPIRWIGAFVAMTSDIPSVPVNSLTATDGSPFSAMRRIPSEAGRPGRNNANPRRCLFQR